MPLLQLPAGHQRAVLMAPVEPEMEDVRAGWVWSDYPSGSNQAAESFSQWGMVGSMMQQQGMANYAMGRMLQQMAKKPGLPHGT